jgi:hypothetical protein
VDWRYFDLSRVWSYQVEAQLCVRHSIRPSMQDFIQQVWKILSAERV